MICNLYRNSVLIATITFFSACSTLPGSGMQEPGKPVQEHQAKQAPQPPEAAVARETQPEPETEIAPGMLYQLLVAEVAIQRGQIDIAVDNYLEAARLTRDPKTASRAVQIARYAQDYIKANEAAEIWVGVAPEDPDARLVYATIKIMAGKPGEAVKQYQTMLELALSRKGMQPGRAFNVIANQLSRIPDRSVALSVMERVIEPYAENPNALFAYSHLAMRQAKFDMAISNLDKALALKPEWPNAVILRARILALQQGREAALAYLNDILEGDLSENIDIGATYAKMLVEAKQYQQAMDQFIRLTELAPDNMDMHYPAGVLALQLKQYDLARELLSTVAKSGQRYYEANYYLGQVFEQGKDYDKAIDRYLLVKRSELYFGAQMRVVSLLATKKEFAKAKQHLQSIRTRNDKQELQVILLEGDLLREQGLLREAKTYYSGILEQMPNETSIRYARALVAEKLDEIGLVESDLQAILAVEPANAQVLNALGYTLADRTDRYEEALGYIKKALEMEPEDAAIMDSMGWVLYRLGNYQEAISHLRRANDLAKDPEIAAHLGEVLWVSGNQDAARDVWNDSLRGNPDHKILREVMKRFGL